MLPLAAAGCGALPPAAAWGGGGEEGERGNRDCARGSSSAARERPAPGCGSPPTPAAASGILPLPAAVCGMLPLSAGVCAAATAEEGRGASSAGTPAACGRLPQSTVRSGIGGGEREEGGRA